ncbi:decarboxylase [Phyllobacterium phragmitis]|uniref:Decarboxylase n=1 Tax=Phyllobacterium phragmitis TaxID=2670329 RepID=A0A2S9IJU3_9HYPH|nr:Y4yA family PLP-dependent enzyme [Phyllobacterium phragmitis]PRD40796.1 decarboxylase [Phyllobacterium phragmitis]
MTLHCHKLGAGLPPILRSLTADLLAQQSTQLFDWVARYGSPLNLIWPEVLQENLTALKGVLTEHRVEHALYYGAKINKSPGLIGVALRTGAGIDVSSLYELRDARQLGANGLKLVATGPAKTDIFLKELIACNALISVDSPEELEDLINCLSPETSPQPVLLRVRPTNQGNSRFGMPAEAVIQCLTRIAQENRLHFSGLHFHLNGYRWEDRAAALREAAALVAEARRMGFSPSMIDIGGGLPIQYVDQQHYQAYLASQTSDDYRTGKVPGSFYPYGSVLSAKDWLRRLLQAETGDGRAIADYFAREGLILGMEPGRALADQAAITAFRITRVKALDQNTHVIFVEGSSFSACETWFASEFLVDPILIPTARAPSLSPPIRAYLAGHSCLDDDVLSNRWLTFPITPQAGDLLVYANTAGYQMDLLENEFHRHPMPARLRVMRSSEGQITLSPDTIEEV